LTPGGAFANVALVNPQPGRGLGLLLASLLSASASGAPLDSASPAPPDVGPGPVALRDCALLFDRGDYPGVLERCRGRLKADPKDVGTRILLARAEAALGRFDVALGGFQEALAIAPRNTDALYYLSLTAGVLAQGEYQRLVATAPDSARAHQVLAEAHASQDRPAEAEDEYKAALEKSPASLELLIALGDLTRSKSRFDDALSYYNRAAAIAPSDYSALYGIGVCYSYQGQQAKAALSFREALKADPRSASAHFALGISLLQTGQTQDAVTELRTATSLEPRMRQAYYQLGRAYRMLGRTAEAEAASARFQELLEQERAERSVEPSPPQ
jgi:protein O-GlcNAc transferase